MVTKYKVGDIIETNNLYHKAFYQIVGTEEGDYEYKLVHDPLLEIERDKFYYDPYKLLESVCDFVTNDADLFNLVYLKIMKK